MSERDVNEILQRLARVETKLDIVLEDREIVAKAMKTANEAMYRIKSNEERIKRIESHQTWLWRTIVTSIIGVVIGFFTKFWER